MHRFQEGVLDSGLDQPALEFVGERTGRQDQCLVEGKEAGSAGAGVAHANDFDRSKDGSQRPRSEAPVRVEDFAVIPLPAHGGADIATATVLQVSLEKEALDFAALVLSLGLDLVEGELEGTGGNQPGLQQSELDRGGRRTGICSFPILTVLSP